MNGMVVISGASGLIGRRLQEYFREKGHLVRTIGRAELRLSPAELASRLEGAAVLINLAGAPIAQRWTAAARREIMDSRVLSTRSLVQAIEGMDRPPALLMNASAIGIYTTEGLHTEDSRSFDGGFLGEVCQAWEAAAQPAAERTRLVILRLGVVLDGEGGALARLLPLFRAGLGGRIGTGRQPFCWIHSGDLAEAVEFLWQHDGIRGAVNMVSPQRVDNREFTRALARVLHRPAVLPVPALALKGFMGKASAVLLEGQEVVPARLQAEGFVFRHERLEDALGELLAP